MLDKKKHLIQEQLKVMVIMEFQQEKLNLKMVNEWSFKNILSSGKLQSEATFKDNVQVGVQKDYYEMESKI